MTLNATEQAILTVVQGDLAGAAGPLVTFLDSIEEADGNLGLEAAALLQLEGTLPGAGISLGIELQNQIVSIALSKLKSYIASKTPASSAPAPAPAAAAKPS
jgi:hypothetical protein